MSAIFGIQHRDRSPVTGPQLQPMREAMEPWRRDAEGVRCEGPVGLGCLLQRTTPESRNEHGPERDRRSPGRLIVADARIDNRPELLSDLDIAGSDAAATPDSLLILRAYERWGESCTQHLLGDFAFALWDPRRQALFCARDPVGARPFLFHQDHRRFVFASDVAAILAVGGVPAELDEEIMVAHFIHYQRPQLSRSFFHGIDKLPPAHQLCSESKPAVPSRYWFPERIAPLRLSNAEEYREALAEQLSRAVNCRLRTSGKVASHLSGGLDSSTLTVLASRELRRCGRSLAGAFSWSPPEDELAVSALDERALVRQVCRQEDIECHFTRLKDEDVIAYQERDPALLPTRTLLHELAVMQAAQRQGASVMLSGWGGDEVVSYNGRGYLAELALQGHWRTLWRQSKQLGTRYGGGPWRTLRHHALPPLLPDWLSVLTRRNLPQWSLLMFQQTGVGRKELGSLAMDLLQRKWREEKIRPGIRYNQLKLLNLGHLSCRMESWAQSGARFEVEYRYPLLDRRLLEHCLSLPGEQAVDAGWKRYGLRRAVEDCLPADICWATSKQEPAKWGYQQRVEIMGLEQYLARHNLQDRDPPAEVIRQRFTNFTLAFIKSIPRST